MAVDPPIVRTSYLSLFSLDLDMPNQPKTQHKMGSQIGNMLAIWKWYVIPEYCRKIFLRPGIALIPECYSYQSF